MPLRFGATMGNIGFAIPNMISDTAQAAVYSTAGFIPVVDNAIGVLNILAVENKHVENFLNQIAPEYTKKVNFMYELYKQSGAPSSTRLSQYRKSTQSIWIGSIFNYSPAKIDNLISGYFGGLGTSVTNTIDYVLGKMGVIPEQAEMGAERNSVGKRFFVNVNSNSKSLDELYKTKDELTKKKNGGTITSEETKQLEKINEA